MKLYKKIAVALCVVLATSCTLDLREDPNAVQPNQVLPSLMLNSMERNLAAFFNGASGVGGGLTRQINRGSSVYRTTITPETFNGIWSTAYASILEDANTLMKLAVPDKLNKPNERYARHMGISRIIQAYTLITLVDMFGDIPFSEAFQGDANFNPGVDSQLDIYNLAIQMLDSAKLDLTTNATTQVPPGYQSPIAPDLFDMYYGTGSVGTPVFVAGSNPPVLTTFPKWIKLANTLKLKIYLNMRLIDPATATAGINALLVDPSLSANGQTLGGLIGYTPAHTVNAATGAGESFIFRYSTNTADPDSRHPAFVGQYPGGGGAYQANWYMWAMLYGYDATHNDPDGIGPLLPSLGDPRTRFYFYRQTLSNSTSTNEISCLGASIPSHYPATTGSAIIDNSIAGRPPMGTGAANPTNDPTDAAWGTTPQPRTFCYVSSIGYWGRDHLDPSGIPPDGQLRTAYGPYPVGGRFDNNAGAPLGVTGSASFGMRGAGMEPIIMRSFVNFMLSEAALYLTLAGARTPTAYFQDGVDQSIQDTRDWTVNGTLGTTTVGAAPNEAATINAFYPNATFITDKTAYTTAAVNAFNQSLAGTNFPADLPTGLVPGTLQDEAMNYVAREYWIASNGNGIEAYNLYRRTGMPSGMQPVLSPTPGDFPRSYWYPANFARLNNSVDQKADLKLPVFWDNNGTNLSF